MPLHPRCAVRVKVRVGLAEEVVVAPLGHRAWRLLVRVRVWVRVWVRVRVRVRVRI